MTTNARARRTGESPRCSKPRKSIRVLLVGKVRIVAHFVILCQVFDSVLCPSRSADLPIAWGFWRESSSLRMEFRWKTLLLLSLVLPAIVLCEDAVNANLAADLQEAVEAQQAGEEVTEPVEAKIIKEAPIGVLPSGTGDVATTGT